MVYYCYYYYYYYHYYYLFFRTGWHTKRFPLHGKLKSPPFYYSLRTRSRLLKTISRCVRWVLSRDQRNRVGDRINGEAKDSILGLHPQWIKSSEICIILRIIRKPNAIYISLFIQNIFKFLTSLPPRWLSSELWLFLAQFQDINMGFCPADISSVKK